MSTTTQIRGVLFALLSSALLFVTLFVTHQYAEAAIADWQKGMSIVPHSQTDFQSEEFRQSLQALRATGITHLGLVVPYYQSDIHSSDVHEGGNTPTDDALRAAIDYAHSLGFQVMLKPHVEPYTGHWRAEINPNDRNAWFAAYGSRVVHLAEIAEQHGVDYLLIGTELISLTAETIHPDNTQHWRDLISDVRAVFSGAISYNANSTHYNPGNNNVFQDEKRFVGFWDAVDFVGLSVYYNLDTPTDSVEDLKQGWDMRNDNDIRPFQQQVGKPIVFTEIGYRSLDGARYAPWDWQRGGSPDQQEQANLYEALISYWNDYSYMQGVYWWEWEPYPNAGGAGSTDYTPQNKQASQVLTNYFTSSVPPDPDPDETSFSSTVSTAQTGTVGSSHQLAANVTVTGGSFNGIVDLEISDANGGQVFQRFFENESFTDGASRSFNAQWTPASNGTYRVSVGIFRPNWSETVHWNHEAANISIGGTEPPPDPDPDPDDPPPPPPPDSGAIEIWWPTNGASVSGTQPFKAMVQGLDISQYQMFWQVDGDRLNDMYDSQQDYPHKEAIVDLSNWNWRGSGPYTLTFVAQQSGSTIGTKSVDINVY